MAQIKSRPVYAPFALDPTGTRHLLLVEAPEPPEPAQHLPIETWLIAGNSRALPGPVEPTTTPVRTRAFRSRAHMLERLEQHLDRETMGLRLYAIGTEDFLWDVRTAAFRAGLSAQETRLTHAGSLRRRVICVHCRAVTEAVTTSIVACSGCGASLFVRDHFSRRLAGFQGVQVDAETPGAVPVAEELYP